MQGDLGSYHYLNEILLSFDTFLIQKDEINALRSDGKNWRGSEKAHDQKELLFEPTPEEFAGAVHWAHERGFLGEGSSVLVLESISGKGPPGFPENKVKVYPHSSANWRSSEHGNQVVSRVLGIAPHSHCIVADPSETIFDNQHQNDFKSIKIVNASFAWRKNKNSDQNQEKIEKTLEFIKNRVYVHAFGNEHKELAEEESRDLGDICILPDFLSNAILVVSVDRDSSLSDFSNRPQDTADYWHASDKQKQKVMENTISALGDHIVGVNSFGEVGNVSGTSFAAPTVAGALALVEGMGKTAGIELDALELKGVLLNSARQEAFIPKGNYEGYSDFYLPKVSYKYGQQGTMISDALYEQVKRESLQDKSGANPSVFKDEVQKNGIIYKPFDPTQYGRGFLDIRRVMKLAKLYMIQKKKDLKKKGDASPQDIAKSL